MKSLGLLLAVLISGFLFAQPNGVERTAPESEKAVLKLEQDFLVAVLRSDAAAIEPMLADDFHFVGSDGAVLGKTAFAAPIRFGEVKMLTSDMSDVQVHFSTADRVVLTYRSADRGLFKRSGVQRQFSVV